MLNKVDLLPKGYVKVCEDRTGKYLCVPKKVADKRNWMTRRAIIFNEVTGSVSYKMHFQAAFKWITWYLLPKFEEEEE